jgi:4-carboxymuconolactone decarboxylase
MVMSDPVWEAGNRVRREVLGDEYVDRQSAPSEFRRPFQEYLTRTAWGSVWTREGLDRKTRSCITLAVLTALGRTEEIPLHVRGALRNGLTEQEISEVLLHTAVYAGVPAARTAFEVAERTLRANS